jgi:two-component system, NarL family, invasion response regulator UvrY
VIRVLLADDHKIFREGIKRLLGAAGDIVVAAEAADGADALEQLRSGAIDVAVLDINMPRRNGLEVVACIRKRWPHVAAIVLSMYPEEQYATQAFRAGAVAYLTKGAGWEELVAAIRRAAAGAHYVSAGLGEKLAGPQQDATHPPHFALSAREHQIFDLIVAGCSLTAIAGQLDVSVSTVSTYRTRVLEKMNAHSNAELVAYAIRNHLRD